MYNSIHSYYSCWRKILCAPGFLFYITFFLSACGSPKNQLTKEMTKLEKEVSLHYTKDNASKLIGDYDKFITSFTEDTSRKGYMVKAAELSILQQDADKALKFINLFLKDYPDDPRAGLLQFKKGMVYDLLLHDGLRAVAEYKTFIKKYPTHSMKQDAEYAVFIIEDPDGYMNQVLKNNGAKDSL